jgi:hypothetical protein
VLDIISHAEYARGHLLFVRDGALLAQAFDPNRMVTEGPPRTLAEQINVLLPTTPVGAFSASGDGVLAFEGPVSSSSLVWLDRQGREIGTVGSRARYSPNRVQLSRDGTRALVASYDASLRSHVVAIDVVRNLERRVTVGAGGEGLAVWSPDGTRVALVSVSGVNASQVGRAVLSEWPLGGIHLI